MPDKLPPHIRAQIEDFKRKATHNEALSKEYRDKYDRTHTPNQPTYEQWLKDNGKQRLAKGGSAKEEFLKNSKVKHPVYHVAKTEVREFSPKHRTNLSSMGHHFGTADQANFRAKQYDFESKNPNMGKFHLSMKNPLEVSHMASFAPDHLAEHMMDINILDPEKYEAMSEKHNYDSLKLGNELVKILKKQGDDGPGT